MSAPIYREPEDDSSDRAERARRLFLGQHDMPWREQAVCRRETLAEQREMLAIFWEPRIE